LRNFRFKNLASITIALENQFNWPTLPHWKFNAFFFSYINLPKLEIDIPLTYHQYLICMHTEATVMLRGKAKFFIFSICS
jgi:hypothetical protein